MPSLNFGQFSYPGISPGMYESFKITDVSGISPAVGILKMYPQFGFPAADGDIVLTYNDNTIVFKNCHIDNYSFDRGSGGKIVTVRFLDERWTWKNAQVTLRANIRLPNNFVDPLHLRTPQQLAAYCFQALGVTDFDVSALPNDATPDIDWVHVNAAEALARLCDDLGCRIVPRRSDGFWTVVTTGIGETLPDGGLPYNDGGDGQDPPELPDYIKIVSAPVLFQMGVNTEGVGRNPDLGWAPLKSLSYAPNPGGSSPYGFDQDYWGFSNIDHNRIRLPDGTLKSPHELALESVFKCFRIQDNTPFGVNPNPSIKIPGYPTPVYRKQMILTNELVTSYTDSYGGQHRRPAFMFGTFRGWKIDSAVGNMTGNYPFGKRIDFQTQRSDQLSLEEQVSFNMSLDPIDSDRCIMTVSHPMVFNKNFTVANPSYDVAPLYLMCGVQIRDIDTWQPVRNEYLYQIGPGTDTNNCLDVIKNDIQPWYIAKYDFSAMVSPSDSNGNLIPASVSNNQDEVIRQSRYYAQQVAQTFFTVNTSTRNFIGLFPIDMDGAIQQITYRTGKTGSDTVASYGTEHDFDRPTYWDRRQRDGRQNTEQKLLLLKEISEQKAALKQGGIDT